METLLLWLWAPFVVTVLFVMAEVLRRRDRRDRHAPGE
jgi:cytochrome c-type biogenesis protein CcmH/NrfF